jgi:hypothetical protein
MLNSCLWAKEAGLGRLIVAGLLEIETDHRMIHVCGLNEDSLICCQDDRRQGGTVDKRTKFTACINQMTQFICSCMGGISEYLELVV